MRVITGSAKGMRLLTVDGLDTRPTSDRVKEAVFSILSGDIEDALVLDLFAGSGALGIEALSRGAKSCVFTDQNRNSISVIKSNLEKTRLSDKGEVIQADAFSYLESCRAKFDIVFLDPPYDKNFIQKSLCIMDINDIISHKGVIVCESSSKDLIEDQYVHFYKGREYLYGGTKITILHKRGQ